MPRTRLGDRVAADKAARDAQIAALPPEVAAAVRQMSPSEQDQYLASLDKVDAMQAAGETFEPDLSDARWGTKADGTPRKKPGRRPATNPGQRSAAKMTRDGIGPTLEDYLAQIPLEEHPEDDPEATVQFGYGSYYEGDQNGKPIAQPENPPLSRPPRNSRLRSARNNRLS
jgi:hypothetical protein